MSYPHTIRLRGPWEFETLVDVSADANGTRAADHGRVTLPYDWGSTHGDHFRGVVRYKRRFNRPTNLASDERVWLVCEGVDAAGYAWLGGHRLGAIDGYALAAEFDITDLLADANELWLDVYTADQWPAAGQPATSAHSAAESLPEPPLRPGRESLPGGPIGVSRLEIRSRAFIDDLAFVLSPSADAPELTISGIVAGDADEPLALVVSGAEREWLYAEASPGQPFIHTAPAPGAIEWTASFGLTPIEIKLMGRSQAHWQATLSSAVRTFDVASIQRLVPYSTRSAAHAESFLADGLWRIDQILPETSYQMFDRAAMAVVQAVPATWAPVVCRRLAHHPAIVAWTTLGGEAAPRAALPGDWRPWLDHSNGGVNRL